jgi:hypothetical protein
MITERIIAVILVALCCLLAGCGRDSADTQSHLREKPSLYYLAVAPSLADERSTYRREIDNALSDVVTWFDAAGYPLRPGDLIDSAIVFDDLALAKRSLAAAFGVDEHDIPDTFGGTVGGRTLFLASQRLYQPTWADLYADWPWTEATYHGLVVHELAHRAHEAIALSHSGTADAMGPIWFFEGLAVTCAGQFDGGDTPLTREEIESYVGEGRTPEVSYPLYGRLVRSLAHHFELRVLIERAAEPGFPDSLWNGTVDASQGNATRLEHTALYAGLVDSASVAPINIASSTLSVCNSSMMRSRLTSVTMM